MADYREPPLQNEKWHEGKVTHRVLLPRECPWVLVHDFIDTQRLTAISSLHEMTHCTLLTPSQLFSGGTVWTSLV